MERFNEIWGAMPTLFMLIILSSLFSPSFWLLVILLSMFGWRWWQARKWRRRALRYEGRD